MPEKGTPKIVCVRITGSEQAVRAFLAKHPMQAEYHRREGNAVVVEAFVPEPSVADIEGKDLKVEVLYDATARGRERQKEVGKGNRFEGEERIPKGLGTKTRGEPQ